MGVRFGVEVRNARVKKGVSLRKLSDELGFTPAYVSDIERGNRNPPSPERVAKWAKVIDVDADRLIHLASIDRPSVELVNNGSLDKSELANMLARAWQDMTPDQVHRLKDQAHQILGGE
jgi:transcriptional regulator with XRE-family HTH domain